MNPINSVSIQDTSHKKKFFKNWSYHNWYDSCTNYSLIFFSEKFPCHIIFFLSVIIWKHIPQEGENSLSVIIMPIWASMFDVGFITLLNFPLCFISRVCIMLDMVP